VSSWRPSCRKPFSDKWRYWPDPILYYSLFCAAHVTRTPASLAHLFPQPVFGRVEALVG
jgi:hypothetical protein